MSAVTTCPACSTRFYVRDEHLSAHGGDVRCGKCNHVFNALDKLQELEETASDVSSPESVIEITAEPAVVPEPALPSNPAISHLPNRNENVSAFFDGMQSSIESQVIRKRKFPKWLLVILAVLLLFFALIQFVYYERTAVSVRFPLLKPYLVQACDLLKCVVELPRRADLLAIDDSDLQEDPEHEGLIHLNSVLINRAAFAQAYPLLELTLTDTDDKPVLRRIFTPAEYLTPNADISGGIAAGEELHIKLDLTASGIVVFGYRVFVTYP